MTGTATSHSRGRRLPSRRPADVGRAVRPIADRVAEAHGLVLWDVSFVREAGRDTLRVACDRPGGVGSDELSSLAEDLSRELDHTDAVPGDARYLLEVTSPGAERKLVTPQHFDVCTGRVARVTLRDGRSVEGQIGDVTDKTVDLEVDDGTVRVFFDDITKAQLVIRGFS